MDRQEKKKSEGNFENGSENGSPEDSDIDDKVRQVLLSKLSGYFLMYNVSTLPPLCSPELWKLEMADSRHQTQQSNP